ncbi:Rossmann-like and DUF2520 domain-containing protein [Aurantivibrio plasticivorans]
MATRNISLIGSGIVASTLASTFQDNGITVSAIGARNIEKAKNQFSSMMPATAVTTIADAAKQADILFILVSDDAISSIVEMLHQENAIRPNTILIHCSGALSSSVLKRSSHYAVASAHPLQTFPSVKQAKNSLKHCIWCCEGDTEALNAVRPMIETVSQQFLEIDSSAKTLYHCGAVFASNYLVALIDAALECNEFAGIDRHDALTALRPLINATLDNIQTRGTTEALTGPIARGDKETIRHHLTSLDKQSALLGIYKSLGERTLRLASNKGTASPENLMCIEQILSEHPEN